MNISNDIFDINDSNFDTQVLKQSETKLVLVDFWAGWCNPCKMLMPILEKVVNSYAGDVCLAKIDAEKHRELMQRYYVKSLPTVLFFKNQIVVEQFSAVQSEQHILSLIENHRGPNLDDELASLSTQIQSGDVKSALTSLAELNTLHPGNADIIEIFVTAIMQTDDFEKAQLVVKTLPENELRDQLSAKITLNALLKNDPPPEDIAERYEMSLQLALDQKHQAALDVLIELFEAYPQLYAKNFQPAIQAIFDALGGRGPIVTLSRSKISRLRQAL